MTKKKEQAIALLWLQGGVYITPVVGYPPWEAWCPESTDFKGSGLSPMDALNDLIEVIAYDYDLPLMVEHKTLSNDVARTRNVEKIVRERDELDERMRHYEQMERS